MKTEVLTDLEQIESVIKACSVCYVGLIDSDGSPYVIPMNFGYYKNIIYLHSAPTGNLVDKVKNDNRICITFCSDGELVYQHPDVACSYRMKAESIVCKGKVGFVDDFDKKVEILNIIMKQYVKDKSFNYSKPAVENVLIWEVPIEKATGKSFGVPHAGPQIIRGGK